MRWSSTRSGLAARAAFVALAGLVGAGAPARAQGLRETSLWATVVFARPTFAGGGLGLAWRDRGRTRLAIGAAAGGEDGAGVAGRLEGMWHFLLDPGRRTGNAVYGGAGVALALSGDGRAYPAVQLVLGAENAPASRRGSFVEIGVGRGVRVAAGMRWRSRR